MLDKIIELTNATPSGGFGSFVGHCPTHNDKNKSLSITKTTDDKILFKCHAGCSQESVIDYFKKNNAWYSSKLSVYDDTQEKLKNLWDSSDAIIDNDHAAKYFKLRGIVLHTIPNSLRFSSSCYNSELKRNTFALVARIKNIKNELIGIQRIYLNKDGGKLDVETPKRILGSCSGGYVEFKGDTSSGIIHVVEGIETGLAIFSSFYETTICAVSATNLSKIPTDETVKTAHLWADKDKSGTGQREAEKAAQEFASRGIMAIVHCPKADIAENSKSVDFLDVYVKNPNEIIEEKALGKIYNNEIIPIKMPRYHLPQVTDQYLPLVLREWAFAQAKRLRVPVEIIIVPLLSIIGSLIGTRLAIQPKKKDFWTVYSNLWGMVIAPPGTKKSAALSTSLKILNKIELKENKKNRHEKLQNENELTEVTIKIADLKKKKKEAILNDDNNEKIKCQKSLSALIKRKDQLEVPIKRYSTSAFSPEKLVDMLGDNPAGILIPKDELSGLFETFGKKGQEGTRQFMLEGWNGDLPHNYDIISRPSKPIEKNCITILGGTQPSVINKMLAEMRADKNDDGLLQRFQLVAYPNQDIAPAFVDEGLDQELQDNVEILIEKICNLDATKFGIKTPDDDTCFSKLRDDSYLIFAEYMQQIEKEVHLAENGAYKNHINKFPKLLSGLILELHVIDNIETDKTNHHALPHVVEMAILWSDLFKEHAKKLYDTEYNFEALSGFALAKKISEGKVVDGISIRALHRNGWTNLKSSQEVEAAVQFLEKHNWLQMIEEKPATGRSSVKLKFNKNLNEFIAQGNWHE